MEEFAGILAAAARQKDIVLDKAQLAAGLDMTIRNMKNQGQDRELSDQELEGMASGGIWPMVIFTFGLMEMAVSLFPGNDGQPAGGERRG
ncbi:MAG TPA: hypothetical protein VNS29_12035 [Burkholderiaceae bacterium]|nr:hypothetical protein [Burkholderiaceae bacterium]